MQTYDRNKFKLLNFHLAFRDPEGNEILVPVSLYITKNILMPEALGELHDIQTSLHAHTPDRCEDIMGEYVRRHPKCYWERDDKDETKKGGQL